MDYAGAIAVLILTPVLWILSHKFFDFIYFGNVGQSIIKELITCFFISLILVSVLLAGGGFVLRSIGGIGKVVLIVVIAGIVIAKFRQKSGK